MSHDMRVIAGECTTTYTDGTDERVHRGHVVVLLKPDNTVLVHDAAGYQPVAWLTRPASLSVAPDLTVRAGEGDSTLRVRVHEERADARVPASTAGVPVGTCPDCEETLVRARGTVACLGPDCDRTHGLPAGAAVLEEACECGLPRIRAARGDVFEVCVDRTCDPLADAVREAFDGAWSCPDCEAPMEVVEKGRLLAGCSRYPACDTAYTIPEGTVSVTCDCGLPGFDTPRGRRCLDATCDRFEAADAAATEAEP